MAVAWASQDSHLSIFNPATGRLDGKVLFTTPGSVDTNSVTRFQYTPNARITAVSRMDWSQPSLTNGNDESWGGAAMYWCRADQVVGTPTAFEIFTAARAAGSNFELGGSFRSDVTFQISSSTEVSITPPGVKHLEVLGPYTSQLTAGAKYWLLLVPIIFGRYVSPYKEPYGNNVVNATWGSPTDNAPYNSPSRVNSLGRAVSFWTNRAPNAPVITAPAVSNISVDPSSAFDLSFASGDPDALPGGTSSFYSDVAGVQIQYAPKPTQAVPTPTWQNLPVGNKTGQITPGWAIKATSAIPNDGGGVFAMIDSRTLKIRCGANTVGANEGVLPAGEWQVRMRTFDWGHGEPALYPPVYPALPERPNADLTPEKYPSYNISPWSAVVNVSVATQVPTPVPVTPTNSAAIVNTSDVALVWQYRNKANPPFPQASRNVQIRVVGAAEWTSVASGAGSASFVGLGSYPLETGRQYEWRVQTTDSSGQESNFSQPARFWVVPAPASGETMPVPSDTTQGATLGCGTHRVFVFRRGGLRRVAEITGLSSVKWSRVRDDISTAKIEISGWDEDCGNLLARLQTWAYEIVIFRDNGFTVDRVWEGPITLLTYETETVTVQAKDVMAYAYRRIIKQALNDSGKNNGKTVVDRARRVLQNVFAPDDPNVLAYLQVIAGLDDVVQYRSTPAYSRTAFEEVDDMASNQGLDYTVVGRAILLWGTKNRIGTLPMFGDDDLGSKPIVSEYGMSAANVYAISDGNGTHGEADRLNDQGQDPIYGLIEMLSSTWASDSPEDSGTYTQEGLETISESFEKSANRSIAARYPPPVVVRVPDNTGLNASLVLSIQQLVPGVAIPLRSTSTLRTVKATQKLDSLTVTEAKGEETITVTMSPFSLNDASAGSEGEEA